MEKMAEATVLRPADELGPVLSGRFAAETLREQIEASVATGEQIVIDFAGVEAISPSFADELFAKLPRRLIESNQIQFENLDEDLLALARFVIAGRAAS
jgi:hypothetical protein